MNYFFLTFFGFKCRRALTHVPYEKRGIAQMLDTKAWKFLM